MPVKKGYRLILLLFACCGAAIADYKEDIGYDRLFDEQGSNTPDGSGVPVTQAETLSDNTLSYMPDVNDGQFTGKTINAMSGSVPDGASSGHATAVGRLFYGNSSSITPQVSLVNIYHSDSWLSSDYLRVIERSSKPDAVPDRIANHSWIGDLPYNVALEAVKRVDWVVGNDEFLQVAGLKNNTSTNSRLLASAFNVISAGLTDGMHGRSTPALDPPYVSGRTRPDLVAPFTNTSSATPVVAAAAALLVDVAHATASLSTDPAETATSNRAGTLIYNAERSEVVKAVLMAGADRVTNNTTNPDPDTPRDITDYRVNAANQSANGLDVRFGAGQINIYNSFHILTAGEQDSKEDKGVAGGNIGLYGFDYDPSFGDAGSNETGSYYFSTGSNPVILTAALVWNVDVAGDSGSSFPGAATLYDLDLRLYDETAGGLVPVAESASQSENTENIWIQLPAGRDYRLQVVPKAGQASFEWDYALAWQMTTLIDTDGDGNPDTTDTDDDNDGQTDTDEINVLGTDPLDPDSDDDGLIDGREIDYGTNPLAVDTDLDQYSDGEEIAAGSDPLDVNSIPLSNGGNGGSNGGGGGCTIYTNHSSGSVDPFWWLLLLACAACAWRHGTDQDVPGK
jgi:hypothetical protein